MSILEIKFSPGEKVWFTHRSKKQTGVIARVEIKAVVDQGKTDMLAAYFVKSPAHEFEEQRFLEYEIFPTEQSLLEYLVNS